MGRCPYTLPLRGAVGSCSRLNFTESDLIQKIVILTFGIYIKFTVVHLIDSHQQNLSI